MRHVNQRTDDRDVAHRVDERARVDRLRQRQHHVMYQLPSYVNQLYAVNRPKMMTPAQSTSAKTPATRPPNGIMGSRSHLATDRYVVRWKYAAFTPARTIRNILVQNRALP